MKFTDVLHQRIKGRQNPNSWRNNSESTQIWSQFLYLLFRSRGYAYRKPTRFAVDVLESIGIAILSGVTLGFISATFSFVQILAFAVFEGLIFTIRNAELERRRLSRKKVTSITLGLVGTAYLVTATFIIIEHGFHFHLVMLLFMRILVSILELVISLTVVRLQFHLRVYINPLVNFSVLFAAVGVLSLGWFLEPKFGLPAVIILFGAVRMITPVYYLFQAKKSFKSLRVMKTTKALRARIWTRGWTRGDTERITLHFLQIIAPLCLSMLAFDAQNYSSVIYFWLAFAFIWKVGQRPFRIIAVDLYNSFLKSKWDLAKLKIKAAIKLTFIISIILTVGFLAMLNNFIGLAALPIVLLASVLAANRIILMAASVSCVDLDLKKIYGFTWVSISVISPFLILNGWNFQEGALLIGVVESIALVLVYYQLKGIQYWERIQFLCGGFRDNPTGKIMINSENFVYRFFHAARMLREILGRRNVPILYLKVKLRRSLRRRSEILEIHQKLSEIVRDRDLVFPFSGQTWLLVLPRASSKNLTVLSQRVFKKLPLLIDEVAECSFDEIFKMKRVRSIQVDGEDDPFRFLSLLEYLVSTWTLNSTYKWWVPHAGGVWKSYDGEAPFRLAQTLSVLTSKVSNFPIYRRREIKKIGEIGTKLYTLNPFGKVLAILETNADLEECRERMEKLNSEFLSAYIHEGKFSDTSQWMTPESFFAFKYYIVPTLERGGLHTRYWDGPISTRINFPQLLAFTHDGLKTKYSLELIDSPISILIADEKDVEDSNEAA